MLSRGANVSGGRLSVSLQADTGSPALAFSDSRLNDLVADNLDKFDITESESLLIGRDFGITTDIETGPNGDLYIVSNTNSAVYQVSGKQPALYIANLNGAQERRRTIRRPPALRLCY